MKKKKIKSLLIQRQGFTLIELIAIIAIIGVLAAAAVPAIGNVVERAQVTQVNNDIKVVSDAVAAYIQETGAVPVANTIQNTQQIQLKAPGVNTWDVNGKAGAPGISVRAFKKAANENTLYLIDISKLTNVSINIDKPTELVEPKLNAVPTASALAKITDEGTTAKTTAANSVKNTSVLFAIDSQLRVYAISNPDLNKTTLNAVTTLPNEGNYNVLNPSEEMKAKQTDANKKGDSDGVFKVPYVTYENTNIATGLAAKDTAYKN